MFPSPVRSWRAGLQGFLHADRPGEDRPADNGTASRAPPTSSAANERRWSADPTPPDAITGTEVDPSTAASPSRSGPASVPSRAISVTTTPPNGASPRRASKSPSAIPTPPPTPAPLPHDHHLPLRGGRCRRDPARVQGGKLAREVGVGCRRGSRARRAPHPPRASVATRASSRIPPPACTYNAVRAAIETTRSRFSGSPDLAASRSTT